jgi:hypothetical protein
LNQKGPARGLSLSGNVGLSGATGALLVHALDELRSLPGRIQSDFRLAD